MAPVTTTEPHPIPSIAPRSETADISASRLLGSAALIVVAGALVYLNSFSGQIVFDDYVINEDPSIRQLWPPWGAMTSPQQVARPLVGLSLAINYAISGTELWSYHLFNLVIHILAGLALFGVVRRTLLSERLKDRFGGASTGLALAIALIWLVHPLHTESVTYLIQRSEAMCGLFYLSALYCVIRAHSGRNTRRWCVAAVLSCAAGMASKPVMATAPILIAIYDWIFLSGSFKELLKRRAILYASLAATWTILAATVLAANPHQESAGFSLREMTPLSYLATQFGVMVHYLRLSMWPYDLCIDYGWPIASGIGEIAGYAIAVAALGLGTLAALKRRPEVGFLGVWFLLILAPTSSIMPILDLAVEHRTYLSLAAIAAFVVLGAYRVAPRFLSSLRQEDSSIARWLAVGAVAIVTAWFGSLTVERNSYYQSQKAMWLDVVRKRPDNPRGHSNLGLYLANEGDLSAAIQQFEEALRLNPNHPDALNNMGMALANSGDRAGAIPYFQRAIQVRPKINNARFNLGQVFASQSQFDEAIAQYREELKVNPGYAEARLQLASALEQQKRFGEAVAGYRETLALAPNWAQPLCRLALLLVGDEAPEVRDPEEAIRLAEKAVLATRRQPVTLDILASVYSSVGRFDDAAATAQEAIDRAKSAEADQLASAIEGRLLMYKQRRAARP